MDPRDLVSEYARVQERYAAFAHDLADLLRRMTRDWPIAPVLESRVKDPAHLLEKAGRPGKRYERLADVTDLAGVRVITQTTSAADDVVEILRQEFEIDEENSVDKSSDLDVDRFGYAARQYIVSLKAPRLAQREYQQFSDLRAEVQVRTVLEDAWARIEYPILYKRAVEEVSRDLQRRLYGLAALFEIADRELDAISAEWRDLVAASAHQIEERHGRIAITADTLAAYVTASPTVEGWLDVVRSLDVTIGPVGAVVRDTHMAADAGLVTIAELDAVLMASKPWGSAFLERFMANTRADLLELGANGSITMDRNSIVPLFLIANFPQVFTVSRLERKWGWGSAWRAHEALSTIAR
jgi:putative GTP pyrophosphokinase